MSQCQLAGQNQAECQQDKRSPAGGQPEDEVLHWGTLVGVDEVVEDAATHSGMDMDIRVELYRRVEL